jgi:hypothetical protein
MLYDLQYAMALSAFTTNRTLFKSIGMNNRSVSVVVGSRLARAPSKIPPSAGEARSRDLRPEPRVPLATRSPCAVWASRTMPPAYGRDLRGCGAVTAALGVGPGAQLSRWRHYPAQCTPLRTASGRVGCVFSHELLRPGHSAWSGDAVPKGTVKYRRSRLHPFSSRPAYCVVTTLVYYLLLL